MRKYIKIAIGIIILGIFIFTIGFLYSKSKKKPEIFETKSPFVTNIEKKTVATGSIIPKKEIEIKPQVSGIIQEIYVESGNYIKKGDFIAKVKVIPDMISLNNAESRYNKAKLAFEDAERVYNRQKKLFDDGVIAESDFQRIELEYLNAREEVNSSDNNLQLIREGVSKKAGEITNTIVRSTIDGMVLDVPVEVGNSVIESNNFNPGTTIAIVANMGQMIFEGKVDESEVAKIIMGMPLTLTIGAINDVKFDAVLNYIAPKGVLENGAIQFKIRADVKLRKDYFIRAGYSANADIVLDRRDSVMAIPENLLIFNKNSDSTFVEVLKGENVFEKKPIKTGLSDGINIEVLEGLTKDDKIKVPKI